VHTISFSRMVTCINKSCSLQGVILLMFPYRVFIVWQVFSRHGFLVHTKGLLARNICSRTWKNSLSVSIVGRRGIGGWYFGDFWSNQLPLGQ
jgi:hypothetical protein